MVRIFKIPLQLLFSSFVWIGGERGGVFRKFLLVEVVGLLWFLVGCELLYFSVGFF
jgi:hypothetical protein